MDNQEPQNTKKKKKQKVSKGSKVNALVILVCIDMIGFMASLYVLKAFDDANLFLIPAALTLVMSVITAMVYVQMRHQDEDDRQRVAGDVAEALSTIIEITKNDQQLMDKKIDDLSEEYQVPAQEIINALKALAKVSLGRSKENATALINSNEAVVTQVMDLQDKIDALENTVNKSAENDLSKVIDDNSHKVVVGLDDLTHDVQRLEQDMRRLEKVTKDLEMHPPVIQGMPVQPQPASEIQTNTATDTDSKELNDATTLPESLTLEIKEPDDSDEFENTDESDLDLSNDLEPPVDDETESVTEEDLTNEPDEVIDDSDDLDLDSFNTDEVEENPNRQMTSEEIEAAFAAANNAEEEPTVDEISELVEESAPEPAEEEPEPEPAPEAEKSEPTVDLSDPNKQLSADEIAALFAHAGNNGDGQSDSGTEEKQDEKEEKPQEDTQNAASPVAPEPSGDPNRMMTPEEIEALFSNVS